MTARFGFPINLAVRDRRCVVIGGGEEAALRVLRLRDAGADLVLVTPEPCDTTLGLVDERVRHHDRAWRPEDLDGAILVIGTREDPLDAERLYAEGKARGALVNVLDDVEHCDYATMSQVVHGDFQLSIATNGRAPAVAKIARKRLEASFGPAWGELVTMVDEAKSVLGPRQVGFDEWARRWSLALVDTDGLLARLRQGDRDGVRRHLVEVVQGDETGPGLHDDVLPAGEAAPWSLAPEAPDPRPDVQAVACYPVVSPTAERSADASARSARRASASRSSR